MGIGCCNRTQQIKTDISNNIISESIEIQNEIKNMPITPEIKYETNEIKKTHEELQLDIIINQILRVFKLKSQKITFIELYNISLLYKNNTDLSPYIIYDMRESQEQKEDFIKKMKHINYSYYQIKNLSRFKRENFKSFLSNKIIILIISNSYLSQIKKSNNNCQSQSNLLAETSEFTSIEEPLTQGRRLEKKGTLKREDSPYDIITLLSSIQNNLKFNILNTTLNMNESPGINTTLCELLNSKNFDILPYIIFTYRHVSCFNSEGFFFIHFNCPAYVFSFQNLIQNMKGRNYNEKPKFENYFLRLMNISTMITFDNLVNNSYKINEIPFKNKVYKEYLLGWDTVLHKRHILLQLTNWINEQISSGHSIYFNILNFINYDKDDPYWLLFIAIILSLASQINIYEIIKYLEIKCNFVHNIGGLIRNFICKERDKLDDLFLNLGIMDIDKKLNNDNENNYEINNTNNYNNNYNSNYLS